MSGIRIELKDEILEFVRVYNLEADIRDFIARSLKNEKLGGMIRYSFSYYKSKMTKILSTVPSNLSETAEKLQAFEDQYDFDSFTEDLVFTFASYLYEVVRTASEPADEDSCVFRIKDMLSEGYSDFEATLYMAAVSLGGRLYSSNMTELTMAALFGDQK